MADFAPQLQDRLAQAITINSTYLALANPSNAQLAAQVKALTREIQAILRLASDQRDSVD